jgi:hypothetical protein
MSEIKARCGANVGFPLTLQMFVQHFAFRKTYRSFNLHFRAA